MIGKRVLVTASRPEPVCRLLAEQGAVPVAVPTIGIRPLEGRPLDAWLEDLGAYDWVVVTSPNGARLVTERLAALDRPMPSRPRWAAVGPRTREALETAGLEVQAEPGDQVAAAIPDAMGEVAGARVLLLRAAGASRELPRILAERGARVDDVVAYEIVVGPESSRASLERALAEGLDAAVFTSGSTVRGFARLTGDPALALAGARVICIGPVTARAARLAGLGDVRANELASRQLRAAGRELDAAARECARRRVIELQTDEEAVAAGWVAAERAGPDRVADGALGRRVAGDPAGGKGVQPLLQLVAEALDLEQGGRIRLGRERRGDGDRDDREARPQRAVGHAVTGRARRRGSGGTRRSTTSSAARRMAGRCRSGRRTSASRGLASAPRRRRSRRSAS